MPAPRFAAFAPRLLRRWGGRLAGALALAVLGITCAGWSVLHRVDDSIARVDAFGAPHERPPDDRPPDDRATTFLVVGTDERAGIPAQLLKNTLHAGGEACHCTDTVMLVQLARDGGRASVVSLPRDSYLEIPAHQDQATHQQVPAGRGKLNAAYGMGGPELTVRTVEQATGLRIDHYLQVDFLAFVSTVDALGGVQVCTNRPLRDEYAGLDLPAGSTRLDGVGALKYVRARHLDASADLGRMRRQQRLLAQLLHQAADSGTLLDPARLAAAAGGVLKALKADQQLTGQDLLELAGRLKGLSVATADFATVPLAEVDHPVPGWGSTVLWDQAGAKALFDAVRAGRPLSTPTTPAAVATASAMARAAGRSPHPPPPGTPSPPPGAGPGITTGAEIDCP